MTKKILIVDDDPVITRYLDVLFKDHGYELTPDIFYGV
jgi:DNA-binding response OmpR family regulator